MTPHQGQTNEVTQIELKSTIQQVLWTRQLAAPGGEVSLEITTSYVGNGGKLEIELSDHSGKKHGKFKEIIAGNRFRALIRIPEDARDALYADVSLPKHGLKQKSPALLLTPPIEITNLKWSKEEARRGDVLTLTADIEGIPDGASTEISIWEFDDDLAHDLVTKFNAAVSEGKIEADWEYEYHEDTDEIPSEEENAKGYNPPEYFFRVSIFGLFADSDLLEFKDWIEFKLLDSENNPVANEDYVLTLPDGSTRSGSLNSDGLLREEDIPPGPYEIELPNLDDATSLWET